MVRRSRCLCSSLTRSAATFASSRGASASAAASSASSASISACARPTQRHAPTKALAHGARAVEPGRRAVAGEAGARELRRLQVLELDLDQVRQLQIVEEQVEEFLLGQREGELVLALAVGAALAAAPAAAALRLGDLVADPVLLVARQDVVARAGVAARARSDGSRRLFERMVTFSAPSASETLRDFSESLMASRISALARRRKRWRLPRLLDFGLRRRSTICMGCLASCSLADVCGDTARIARAASCACRRS